MALKIEQGYKYRGNDWWDWWIWIDGPAAELDDVEKVVYTLHETFPTPVRIAAKREDNFRLETGGWGTFRIHARLHLKGGGELKLQHDLELYADDGEEE